MLVVESGNATRQSTVSFCNRLGLGNFFSGVGRDLRMRPAEVGYAVQRGTAIATETGYRPP